MGHRPSLPNRWRTLRRNATARDAFKGLRCGPAVIIFRVRCAHRGKFQLRAVGLYSYKTSCPARVSPKVSDRARAPIHHRLQHTHNLNVSEGRRDGLPRISSACLGPGVQRGSWAYNGTYCTYECWQREFLDHEYHRWFPIYSTRAAGIADIT
jgi:hypothetical protein